MSKFSKTAYPKYPNYNNFLNQAHNDLQSTEYWQTKDGGLRNYDHYLTAIKTRMEDKDRNLQIEREKEKEELECKEGMKRKQQKRLYLAIQKKIDIDPTLLLSNKTPSRCSKNYTGNCSNISSFQSTFLCSRDQRKASIRQPTLRASSYVNSPSKILQRPQSKQQPRGKTSWQDPRKHEKDEQQKGTSSIADRPQTAKCRRNLDRESNEIWDQEWGEDIETDDALKLKINPKKHQKTTKLYSELAPPENEQDKTKSKLNLQINLDPEFLDLFAS